MVVEEPEIKTSGRVGQTAGTYPGRRNPLVCRPPQMLAATKEEIHSTANPVADETDSKRFTRSKSNPLVRILISH